MSSDNKPGLSKLLLEYGGVDGPSADRTRAAEIAGMDEFGLLEFIELTGVCAGNFGNHRISTAGVSFLLAEAVNEVDLSNWTADEQTALLLANRLPMLTFPCTPDDFMSWYDAI